MSIIIENEFVADQLASASEPTEIQDSKGRNLGRFIPKANSKMSYPEFGKTDEELLRELEDPNQTWLTAAEAMVHLRGLTQCTP